MKEKIAVAMSGGVDSSLTAAMLIEQGYEVIGLTLKLWVDGLSDDEDTDAVTDAKKMCDFYNIEHYIVDAENLFKDSVIDYFIKEYKNGRTPNPCVFCNRNIKFKLLIDKAVELGCSKLVTGHYAQVKYNEDTKEYEIHKGIDLHKDQSYVLYLLNQDMLSKLWLPIGNQTKTKTREAAIDKDLPVANKPDSLDICFLPDNNYQEFITNNDSANVKFGKIKHENGEVLGKHKGIFNYTVGQRKGLGIAYEYPLYVIKLDAKTNTVYVGPNKSLFKKSIICKHYNFLSDKTPTQKFTCEGKIRYASKPSKCSVTILDDQTMRVDFEEAQRAITPGQSVVLYNGTRLLGGGVIEHTL